MKSPKCCKIISLSEGDCGEVTLTKGYKALVDLEDLEIIANFNWCVIERPSGNAHAMRKDKNNQVVWMHHQVLNRKASLIYDIDHENGNGLDNRKFNLSLKTRRDNSLNSNRSRNASLIELHGNRFRVRPSINGKRIVIGSFSSREEAEAAVRRYREEQYNVAG